MACKHPAGCLIVAPCDPWSWYRGCWWL